jgi:sulfate adenylyltransferase large subunit
MVTVSALTPEGSGASLLRFVTAGSVDDGKSTLIGRLLFDGKTVLADQLAQVEEASRRRGLAHTDLALLTDGLRAEREQGITIDVAYRYFTTARRAFILADAPGHAEYTRNMVSGASTADLALLLVDARHGVVEQTRRHAFLVTLLGVQHVLVCINKMDLVGYQEARFLAVEADIRAAFAHMPRVELSFLPVSALNGDNVVGRSGHMPWWSGPPLLEFLEEVHVPAANAGRISAATGRAPGRFPVQWVIRPQSAEHPDYRGYAGQVAGGEFRVGDEIVVLPRGLTTRIRSLDTFDGPLDVAKAPTTVTMTLENDLDVARGDVIVTPDSLPTVSSELEATVCWTGTAPMRPGARYALKHATKNVGAFVTEVLARRDIKTLEEVADGRPLLTNDIARVRVRTTSPLVFDPYLDNRATGSFILMDEVTNETAAGALIGA